MTRRIIGQLHLWIGLALCIPLVLLGLTGSVLVFEDELRGTAADRDAAGPDRRVRRPRLSPRPRAVAPAGLHPLDLFAAGRTGGVGVGSAHAAATRAARVSTRCGSCRSGVRWKP